MTLLRNAGRLAALTMVVTTAACANLPAEQTVAAAVDEALPVMAWDHRPDGEEWTEAALEALRSEGIGLLSEEPADIRHWCPGYVEAPEEDRAAFWAGLMSSIARYESTWNEDAVGGGGKWFGLLQISPATARSYGCEATTGAALREGEANLECAVRIAARTVTRDGVVAANGGGFAADWGPFANSSKRESMAAWVRDQEYCSL